MNSDSQLGMMCAFFAVAAAMKAGYTITPTTMVYCGLLSLVAYLVLSVRNRASR